MPSCSHEAEPPERGVCVLSHSSHVWHFASPWASLRRAERSGEMIPADIIEFQEQPCWKLSAYGLSYHLHLKPQNVQIFDRLTRWLSGKGSTCQWRRHRRLRCDPWARKTPWRRKCNPLQCSCLKNPMVRDVGLPQSMGSQRVRHDSAPPSHTDVGYGVTCGSVKLWEKKRLPMCLLLHVCFQEEKSSQSFPEKAQPRNSQ